MDNKPALQQKGRHQLQYRGTECTNCGHPLDMSDKFCPNCSQANSTKKLSLKDFFDEFLSTLVSYDSKLLRTLSALITKPGKITKDYIEGKRVSYTNPFRFLLSLTIIYFLILNFSTDFQELDRYGTDKSGNWFKEDGTFSFDSALSENDDKKTLYNQLDSLNIAENIAKGDSLVLSNPKKHFESLTSRWFLGRVFGKREFFSAVFRSERIYEYEKIIDKYTMEDLRENRSGYSMARSLGRFQQSPGSFLSSIVSKLPFAIFFFLPMFTLFIWLAYIRKKNNYTDHLIFSFHNTSLLFILLIISSLIDSVFDINSGWLFIIVFSIYLFWAMRKFYHQNIFKTLAKFLFLNGIFIILAITAMLVFSMGSIFTY